MSSDEDELAELRAARAARTGQPAQSLAALRQQQQQAREAEEARMKGMLQGSAGRGTAGDKPTADEEEGQDDEELQMLRQHLPTSFGAKSKDEESSSLQQFIAQTKRPSFGPPRPPPRRPTGASTDGTGPASGGAAAAAGGAARAPMRITLQQPAQQAQEQQGPTDGADAGGDGEPDVGPPRPPPDSGGDGEGDGEDMVGPPRPPSQTGEDEGGGNGGEEGDGAMEEGEEEEDPYQLPLSHEVVLGSAHAKGVTCMDIDHTGSRLITGSMDYTIRIYDFNGMKRDMKAFRELEPQEGHPVLSVSWSPTGDQFLVATGSPQAKIYDRDGRTLGEFVRGDMYIRDMRNTKGHVSGILAGCWHPTDRWTAMTCSEDGTVRIWDTHNIEQKTVVKPTLAKPVRTAVTTCAYGQEGRLIGAGLMDGSIQLWSVAGKFGASAAVGQVMPPKPQMIEKQNWTYVSRASQLVRDAHVATNEITCLTFSQDGTSLLSRSMDSTLKLWDLRKFTQPVRVWDGLPCGYTTTQCIFSPDEQLILTAATGPGTNEEGGSVVVIDRAKLEVVRKIGVPAAATALAWHHRLNQIFVGTGNRKQGACHVWYDPQRSQRGVLMGAARAPRKPSPFDMTPEMLARAVYDQPLYRRERLTGQKRREALAQDAVKHHKPDPGMAGGAGKQGRIGTTTKTLLTQHLLKMKGRLQAPELLDPREAILRHADKQDEFSRMTAVYQATQPKTIFAQEEDEEEESEE